MLGLLGIVFLVLGAREYSHHGMTDHVILLFCLAGFNFIYTLVKMMRK